MILLVTFLLLAAVLIFVGAPLLRPAVPAQDGAAPPAAEQREQLLSEREHALAALQDLEFEHSIGNLDDEDYAAMRGAQRHKAVAILRELDTDGAETGTAASGETQALVGALTLDARLEEEIGRARQRLAAAAPDEEAARCPNCAKPHAPGARFCTECGQRFEQALVCTTCGAPRLARDKFCAGCGTSFDGEDVEG